MRSVIEMIRFQRNWLCCQTVLLITLLSILLSPSAGHAQHSFTAVLSTGDEIVLNWGNPSSSGLNYDYFQSSDIVSITVNGVAVDLSRVPNRYLELYWHEMPYNLTSNPPPNGQDITSALDYSMMGLYIDDNADTYLHFHSYGNSASGVTDCSGALCASTITSSDNVTVSAFYYGLLDTAAPTLTFSPADGATSVAADGNITITFNEAVRLLDDSALSDTNVDALITLKDTNSSGSNIAFDATISGNVITINPSSDFSSEQTVYVAIGATVEDSANNAITASNATFTVVQTNSPALDFAANEAAIRTVLVDDMMRAVRSSLNASARMMSDVRGRLRGAEGSVPTLSTRSVPLEIDGVASADAGTLTTRGTATASLIRHNGAYSRLFFSDFDIQHDLDTDNTTATLSARVAWEHMVADGTLVGYYVGAEASESDINGTFAGDQTRLGLTVGGYVAHRLADTLYTDAYVSLGVGHSDLDMSNGTLALESDYRSETIIAGASISGAYDYTDYEFRPELAVNYGKTQIGTVFFTGRAYGLVDDTLSLNAGSVSVANVTLRPEVIYAIQNSPTANTNASLSFSPRLICERTMATRRTQNCGSGGEVGYTAHSNDGLRNIDFRIAVDKVGSSRRSSAVLGVEMRF